MMLFDWFSKDSEDADSRKIVAQALAELKIHAALEEEIFYPAVRRKVGAKVMNEADEEHHVAKVLIAELEKMDGRDDHYEAKFTVLAEMYAITSRKRKARCFPRPGGSTSISRN